MEHYPLSEPCTGTLLLPEKQGKFPGVVLLPGSDGGVPELLAEKIVSLGCAVLALGYFGIGNLPPRLENIPLEYFEKALTYFKTLPQVKEQAITLMGYSRGGELALLLGTLFPKLVDRLIACVPSSVVFGGFPDPNRPAWLLNGKPLPFIGALMSKNENLTEAEDLALACAEGRIPFHSNSDGDPYSVVDLFLARHHNRSSLTVIPVERLTCPLLLLSGQQDAIWPSSLYAREIMQRLDETHSPIQRKSCVYPEAGHGLLTGWTGPIYHPFGGFWCTLGGSPEGAAKASALAWQEIRNHLETP